MIYRPVMVYETQQNFGKELNIIKKITVNIGLKIDMLNNLLKK